MDRLNSHGEMLDQLEINAAQSSLFDRSFHNYFTAKLGKIIPTSVEEVIPGDRIIGNTHSVSQFEPLVSPIFGNMVVKEEKFYVPMAEIWPQFDRFFTGKKGDVDKVPTETLRHISEVLVRVHALPPLDYCNFTFVGSHDQNGEISTHSFNVTRVRRCIQILEDAYFNEERSELYQILSEHQALDLIRPVQRIIKGMISKYNNWLEEFAANNITTSTIPTAATYQLYNLSDDVVTAQYSLDLPIWNPYDDLLKIYEFWLGSSSLLDYMGVSNFDFPKLMHDVISTLCTPLTQIPFSVRRELSPLYYIAGDIRFNWLPLRANYCVWYWNYRDQLKEQHALDPEDTFVDAETSDNEIILLILLRVRCWLKDTFTTALDNTGIDGLIIPTDLNSLVDFEYPVETEVTTNGVAPSYNNNLESDAINLTGTGLRLINVGHITYEIPSNYFEPSTGTDEQYEHSSSTGLSIDLFNRIKRLASWIYKRNILGTEYDDVVYSSFMVKVSKSRLRLPELLSVGRSSVSMNTIINNTTIPDSQVAGDKSAVAWCENHSQDCNYFAEEHGYTLSYYTCMPVQSYLRGLDRLYLRQNRFDFAWPEFAHLGMDAIYNCELAGAPLESNKKEFLSVFGYQGRYYDYKSKQSEEHGRLRTDLNYLTFSRKFSLDGKDGEIPLNNYEFVHCWPDTSMFVVDDINEDIIRVDCFHDYKWQRRLPVPSQILN